MNSTIQLTDLLGAVALLLWGLRLIKTGVLRAYGATLRRWIGRGAGNRFSAAFWGFVATLGLQSSTAAAVIIASFTARDIVRPRMAQAMMLGANVGTAVVTLLLSTDAHWMASALILAGVVTFTLAQRARGQNLGKALLGLGFMLLALRLLGGVTVPLRDSEAIATMLAALGDAPVFAVILSAGLAVVASSSLAVVVLVMTLAAAGVVEPALSLWLVAGANLGGAIPPCLAVRSEGLAARRLTLANLLARAAGTLIALVAAEPATAALRALTSDPAGLVVGAHVAFNLGLLLLFLPILGPLGCLSERLLPEQPGSDKFAPNFLDDSLLPMPEMALAVAARETLRLGDIVCEMLDCALISLRDADEAPCAKVTRLENEVDRLHEEVKLYVARLSRGDLDDDDVRRANEVISYAINLEHIGDIIESGLSEIAAKKARKRLSLSAEGLEEIASFFKHTRENLRMAQAIFLSRDPALARRLVDRKTESRKLEAHSAEQHLARVRAGRTEALETSTIHLDLLRDLKRVNAHLASVAYPILENLGMLEENRLKQVNAA